MGQALILSHQRNEDLRLSRWFQCEPSQLHVVATYNLLYNARSWWTRGWLRRDAGQTPHNAGQQPVLPPAVPGARGRGLPGLEEVPPPLPGRRAFPGPVSGDPPGNLTVFIRISQIPLDNVSFFIYSIL